MPTSPRSPLDLDVFLLKIASGGPIYTPTVREKYVIERVLKVCRLGNLLRLTPYVHRALFLLGFVYTAF